MKTSQRFDINLAGLSATCMVAVLAMGLPGPVSADPQSKPTITLAPYVLKNTDLRRGATNAYRPWFENGAWTGDLIEYQIAADGNRCTSVAVGAFPPDDSGNFVACPHDNWSARGTFDAAERAVGGDTFWSDRNIFTYSESGTDRIRPFWWDQLSVHQKDALDEFACGIENTGTGLVCNADGVTQSSPDASDVLNFVRGDRSKERNQPEGILRLRYSVLGPIINSRPVYVPIGSAGVVVVGANDGMVHGFNAEDGSTAFSYVPSVFFPNLHRLSQAPYSFTYFADGELRARSIDSNRHIVAGGFGSGATGLFVMEISGAPATPRMLFELSGTEGEHLAGQYLDYLGHIQGRPNIARLPDGQWYVVAGNGYDSEAGARLVLINLATRAITTIEADASSDNGLSAPALVSSTNDFGVVNYAYAGDLKGNLWRFNLTSREEPTLVFSAGQDRPITVEPDVARHPTQIGVMVYFGTGRLLDAADAVDVSQQGFYGIWDENYRSEDIDPDTLITQTLTQRASTWGGSQRVVRVILNEDPTPPAWTGTDKKSGWKVDFPIAGERVIGRAQVRANRVQFITINPATDIRNPITGDGSWFNQLSLESGGSLYPPSPLYDLDRSGVLDSGDGLTVPTQVNGETVNRLLYPLSLNLGPGNIAQPAFASVVQDIDAVFINALLLLPPDQLTQGRALGGDLDVTSDSPSGPRVDAHDPGHPKYDEYGYGTSYPISATSPPAVPPARGKLNTLLAQDGLGGRVDGHHRSYNKVHGVNYVDFFDIEPQARSGELRLDPGPLDANGQPFLAMRELNQPLETPWEEPMPLGEEEFSPDQKFIVVLTNADLSLGTKIQIGCRSWNSFDYQQMITAQLKANLQPHQLRDERGRSLIFTMDSILTDDGGVNQSGVQQDCDESGNPTLRLSVVGPVGRGLITVNNRGEEVVDLTTPNIHGTLPGCVNGTHGYTGQLLTDGSNSQITRNEENWPNGGFRWRNGALTMQLLSVRDDGTRDYVLQSVALPTGQNNSPVLGNGGIFARGYTVSGGGGNAVPVPAPGPNGLLYEASMFWNWGDMWEYQQEGFQSVCYGASNYNAAFTNELGGLNSAQYTQLTALLRNDPDLQERYEAALIALADAQNDDQRRLALIALAGMFNENAGQKGQQILSMAQYHIMRMYAHEDKFNKNNLLEIDRNLFQPPPPVEIGIDGTPAQVQDVELDLLPAAGPNYAPGRRSWIDITPE